MFEQVEATSSTPERSASSQGNFYQPLKDQVGPGMNSLSTKKITVNILFRFYARSLFLTIVRRKLSITDKMS